MSSSKKYQQKSKTTNSKLTDKSQGYVYVTHIDKHQQNQKKKQVKQLNIQKFKIYPCNISQTHKHKNCMRYHNFKDRKRIGNYYCTNLCTFIKNNEQCPNGDLCNYAHSYVEQFYQYSTYKKKFCSHFPNSINECPYGNFCSFAHSQEEIRIQLVHHYILDEDFYIFYFKTESCPFNLTQHDKSICVYAHNLQDYRRKPSVYEYSPIACYSWKMNEFITSYQQGCPNGVSCNMCHGWKQLQYHPSHYKTKKCQQNQCSKKLCPNYHNQKERRKIEQDIQEQNFVYVPKNRVIDGVFKKINSLGFKSNKDNIRQKDEKDIEINTTSKSIRSQPTEEEKNNEKGQWIKELVYSQEDEDSER